MENWKNKKSENILKAYLKPTNKGQIEQTRNAL